MTHADVTRGEFDMLRQTVQDNQARLGAIDDHGTRGVGVVQAQLTNMVRDLGELKTQFTTQIHELKTDVDKRFESHAELHATEKQERIAGRRWLIGTGIAAVVAVTAVLSLLIPIFISVHG